MTILYRAVRPLLFQLDAERAHGLTLSSLRTLASLRLLNAARPLGSGEPVRLMGLSFPNRVGLAAGFDKNGVCIDGLGALGFGFLEIGTVTPRAQPGNTRPRVFRLPAVSGVINRMGFPNEGVEAAVARIQRRRYTGICGVNIGKNAATPIERAADDYVMCLRTVYDHADYVTINISSPNTAGLRQLQVGAMLEPLLQSLLETREKLRARAGRLVPLLVKLSPDMTDDDLADTAEVLKALRIDGVIATNTTTQRPGLGGMRHGGETGGLSGAPLHSLSVATITMLRRLLGPNFPIVGAGGICSAADASETLAAGANLIQIYTGLVYRGPVLVRELVAQCARDGTSVRSPRSLD
jgi:dihydroorotate dehydrogenase